MATKAADRLRLKIQQHYAPQGFDGFKSAIFADLRGATKIRQNVAFEQKRKRQKLPISNLSTLQNMDGNEAAGDP